VLSPRQAVVLPVSEKFSEYGRKVVERLAAAGLRVELDDRGEKLGYRIREAQVGKTPTCWWWALARRSRARCRCGFAAARSWGRSRSTRSSAGCRNG
jgi:hypothetical protein